MFKTSMCTFNNKKQKIREFCIYSVLYSLNKIHQKTMYVINFDLLLSYPSATCQIKIVNNNRQY